ncbi:MAG TPA: hypothetical protein VF541_04390, partial [Longimicrobium sp.]
MIAAQSGLSPGVAQRLCALVAANSFAFRNRAKGTNEFAATTARSPLRGLGHWRGSLAASSVVAALSPETMPAEESGLSPESRSDFVPL